MVEDHLCFGPSDLMLGSSFIATAQCMAGADALCPKAKISGYYTPGT